MVQKRNCEILTLENRRNSSKMVVPANVSTVLFAQVKLGANVTGNIFSLSQMM